MLNCQVNFFSFCYFAKCICKVYFAKRLVPHPTLAICQVHIAKLPSPYLPNCQYHIAKSLTRHHQKNNLRVPNAPPTKKTNPIFRLHNEGLKHLFLGMVARKWGEGSFHFHMPDVKMGSTWTLIVDIPIFILPCQFEAIFTCCPMKVQTFVFPSFLGGRGMVWCICFYGSLELETSPFK